MCAREIIAILRLRFHGNDTKALLMRGVFLYLMIHSRKEWLTSINLLGLSISSHEKAITDLLSMTEYGDSVSRSNI